MYLGKQRKSYLRDEGENTFVVSIVVIFSLFFLLSFILNYQNVLIYSAVLFYIGFLEGPFLFLGLNKLSKNPGELVDNVDRIFFVILIINIIIIFTVDLPLFFITGNPDIVSGTYGKNTYQFSMLLLICGGYLLGYNKVKKRKTFIVLVSQILLLIVFIITQFRAALPFFLLAYIVMITKLYGKIITRKILPIIASAVIVIVAILFLSQNEEKIEALGFNQWVNIIKNPEEYFSYGKFQIYSNVIKMQKDYPETIVIGTGPGNFMSRANYTFSFEMLVSSKGVGNIIKQVLGIHHPVFSPLSVNYAINQIRMESVLGTWQFSNPNTSYLSPIAEIGIIGGLAIIILYLYLIKSSLKYFNILKEYNPKYVPLSTAFIGGAVYIFGLAFLENYWEIARVTLPLWLLFWAVKTTAYSVEDKLLTGNTYAAE